MQRLQSLALTAALCGCLPSGADTDKEVSNPGKADIWGTDGRTELFSYDGPHKGHASSVGMIIKRTRLELQNDGDALLASSVQSLGDSLNLCEEERFFDQPKAGTCSGFFAGKDIFVTAGHCFTDNNVLADADELCRNNYSIVFDFGYQEAPQNEREDLEFIPKDNLYQCAEVLLYDHRHPANDVAVIRLDRPVTGRVPLEFRREGRPETGDAVVLMGYPQGMPFKFSPGRVQEGAQTPGWDINPFDFGDNIFTDVDMFGGNSGGPLINSRTGWVEGVASVYSGKNTLKNEEQGCNIVPECLDDVNCSYYPSAYPLVEYAEQIDRLLGAE